MRCSGALIVALLALCGVAHAQTSVPADSVAIRLQGCWSAGDGGTRANYCFNAGGELTITPYGRDREVIVRSWRVDEKGNVIVKSGRHSITYLVEHLAPDGFVLVNDKEDVRLEGHKEDKKR